MGKELRDNMIDRRHGMPADSHNTCQVHDLVIRNVDTLFAKADKIMDKIFWILLVQIITTFMVGGDVVLRVIQLVSIK